MASKEMENAIWNKSEDPAAPLRLSRWAGLGAVLSALLLLVAVILPDKAQAEAMIFSLSPLALLPVMGALNQVFEPLAPRQSRLLLAIGIAGLSPILLAILIWGLLRVSGITPSETPQAANISSLYAGITVLVGVWMALAGRLALVKRVLPAGLANAALVAGLSRVAVIVTTVLSTIHSFPGIQPWAWNSILLLFMISHVVFSAWLGGWLLFSRSQM